MRKWDFKRIGIAVGAVLASVLIAYVAFLFWWIYGPWPWGSVISEQPGGWVVVRAEEGGAEYRAWVAPNDRVCEPLLGVLMQVHPVGSKWTAQPVPW